MNKAEILKSLDDIGWFKYPQNDKEKITDKINKSESDHHLCLLHFSFFSDDFYSVDDYKNLFVELEKIIGVNFDKLEYVSGENDLSIDISSNNEVINLEFDFDNFIMIQQVEGELNYLLEELNNESRLLLLPSESESFFYVFVPLALYTKAVEKGVIPNSEYFEYLLEEE